MRASAPSLPSPLSLDSSNDTITCSVDTADSPPHDAQHCLYSSGHPDVVAPESSALQTELASLSGENKNESRQRNSNFVTQSSSNPGACPMNRNSSPSALQPQPQQKTIVQLSKASTIQTPFQEGSLQGRNSVSNVDAKNSSVASVKSNSWLSRCHGRFVPPFTPLRRDKPLYCDDIMIDEDTRRDGLASIALMDSNSTVSSNVPTSFRFASFPASLPRVNPKSKKIISTGSHDEAGLSNPVASLNNVDTKGLEFQSPFSVRGANLDGPVQRWNVLDPYTLMVRKKMNFGGTIECQETNQTEYTVQEESSPIDSNHAGPAGGNDDPDDSHNTSLSSLSVDGFVSHGKTPCFSRQMLRDNGSCFIKESSVHQDDHDRASIGVGFKHPPGSAYLYPIIPESGATNRAVWMSPVVALQESQHDRPETLDFPMQDASDDGASPSLRTRLNFNTLFSPNHHDGDVGVRKRHSVGDEFQSPQDETIPARKIANRKIKNPFPPSVERTGKIGENTFTPLIIGSAADCHDISHISPMEANFRLKLDSTQCSPIQSVEDAEFTSAVDMDIEQTPPVVVEKRGTDTQSPSHSTATSTYSGLCSMSSGTSKSRKLRPMPDMSAFDMGANETSSTTYQTESVGDKAQEHANISSYVQPASPVKALCPPTPLRTPAWALKNALSRSNSLVSNKLLAACPPQVIDEFSSLEDSLGTEEKILTNTGIEANTLSFVDSYSTMGDTNELKASREGITIPEEAVDHSCIACKSQNYTVRKPINKPCSDQSSTEFEPHTKPNTCRKLPKPSRLSTGWNHSDTVTFDIDFDNVSLLGSGAFADVFKARCKSDGLYYAVKRSRQQFRGRRDREQKMTEIRIMQQLQHVSMTHGCEGSVETKKSYCLYVLFFIKAWQEDGYLFSQTELCCRDTCQHLIFNLTNNWDVANKIYPSLTKNLRNEDTLVDKDFARLVPGNTIWKICHDVSCGLSHIHCHNIVHHDIKPANIFFVYNTSLGALCKIGDFGMAGEIGTVQDGHEGDTAYMPGELLENPKKDPKGDIFSLGITLYELAASGNWVIPREGYRWLNIRDASHIPDVPKSRGSEMINLIKRMISPDQEVRPTADEILANNAFLKGSAIQADKFLADYVQDVNTFFAAREKAATNVEQNSAYDRRTPTPMLNKASADSDRCWSVRTPTPGSGPFS